MNRFLEGLTGTIRGLAIYATPRVRTVGLLGFSSGLPLALTFGTLTFWLKESGLSNTSIGLFASIGTPYSLKFLWAPLIDGLKVPVLHRLLGRRRSWLLLTQIGLIIAITALGATTPGVDWAATALLAVVVATLSASQDIVIDAYRVDRLEETEQAAGAAAYVFGYRIAMLVSGAGAVILSEYVDWSLVYAAMAALMSIGVVTTLLSREPDPVESHESVKLQQAAESYIDERQGMSPALRKAGAWVYTYVYSPFAEFATRYGRTTFAVLAFVTLYKFGDSVAGVMTSPFLLELEFTKTEIATVSKSFGFFATIAGLAVGGAMMRSIGLMKSLWVCGILQLATNLVFAIQAMVGHDLNMLAVTIAFENLAGGMGTAALVAYLSSICNSTYTATQYALLSSLFATTRTLLSSSAGWFADQLTWIQFFAGTALAAVPGLLLLAYLSRGIREAELRAQAQSEAEASPA